MKHNPIELAKEMRDLLTSLEGVKGSQYTGIVESALNQANLLVGWSLLVDEKLQSERAMMLVICDQIISTNVALMVSLWQTSNKSFKTKEEEDALYLRCGQLASDIQSDIKMLQAKQREYRNVV